MSFMANAKAASMSDPCFSTSTHAWSFWSSRTNRLMDVSSIMARDALREKKKKKEEEEEEEKRRKEKKRKEKIRKEKKRKERNKEKKYDRKKERSE